MANLEADLAAAAGGGDVGKTSPENTAALSSNVPSIFIFLLVIEVVSGLFLLGFLSLFVSDSDTKLPTIIFNKSSLSVYYGWVSSTMCAFIASATGPGPGPDYFNRKTSKTILFFAVLATLALLSAFGFLGIAIFESLFKP